MNFIIICIALVNARAITRSKVPMVQLYSMTGTHVTVRHSGRVVPTKETASPYGLLKMEYGSQSQGFKIKGVVTGNYLKVKRKRFSATSFELDATEFTEHVESNNFNTYRPIDRPDCKLAITRNGKYRLSCAKKTGRNASFLPRKTHFRHLGHHL